MFEAIQNREADMIPNMGVTDRRKALFSFSRPVETFPVSIFVRESEENISNMQSLTGKNVGVIALNIGEVLLKNHPDVILKIYEDIEDGLFGLLSGNIDAFVYPEPVLWIMARNAGIDDRIKPVGKPLIEISRAISVHKTNQYLLKKIDAAVAELVNSEIYKKNLYPMVWQAQTVLDSIQGCRLYDIDFNLFDYRYGCLALLFYDEIESSLIQKYSKKRSCRT